MTNAHLAADLASDGRVPVAPRIIPMPVGLLAAIAGLSVAFVAVFTSAAIAIVHPAHTTHAGATLLSAPFLLSPGLGMVVAVKLLPSVRKQIQDRRAQLTRLRADSLPERAKHAAQVLQEATTLVEELQAELNARTALLEDVQRHLAESTQQAADLETLSSVDDETTRILNRYFDKALKDRLGGIEHTSRIREWLIGIPVALMVGITAILFAHYLLGF